MIPPEMVQRMCKRKARFNRAEAERRAFWRGMRAYKCPVCFGHHLTTKKSALARNFRRPGQAQKKLPL